MPNPVGSGKGGQGRFPEKGPIYAQTERKKQM